METDRRRTRVRDIAAETGVSIATVSRVLNDHVNVSPRTRELVLQAVERRKTREVGPRAVAVRCPYQLTDYFGLIVSSIAEALRLHGARVLLDAGESSQHTDALSALPDDPGTTAAILVLPPEDGEELVALLRDGGEGFTWAAAAVGSNSAAGYQLGSGMPVMAVGGFNGTDPSPTPERFRQLVAEERVRYFLGGAGMPAQSGSDASRRIAEWVEETFEATEVDGVTVYDLTGPALTGGAQG
ncbi:LacI family DNA-binding transcriptional regulator [Saccharothrix sp. MB29]|nr:LacI family DNA-binding transcriptional regulator [Saccharothrix sp. MB29]